MRPVSTAESFHGGACDHASGRIGDRTFKLGAIHLRDNAGVPSRSSKRLMMGTAANCKLRKELLEEGSGFMTSAPCQNRDHGSYAYSMIKNCQTVRTEGISQPTWARRVLMEAVTPSHRFQRVEMFENPKRSLVTQVMKGRLIFLQVEFSSAECKVVRLS